MQINRYAELNSENTVLRVINADSKEWCEENLGGIWVKAHYPLDAAIGYTYEPSTDTFIAPVQEEVVN
jgi:hypothetical protein